MISGTSRRSFLRGGAAFLAGVGLLGLPLGCANAVGNFGLSRVTGSGKVVARDYALADFTALEAANGFRLDVRRADGYAVKVWADDNLFDHLRVEKQGETLRLGLKDGSYNITTIIRAEVSLPRLSGVTLSGGSTAGLVGFKNGGDFRADLSGGARLDGELVADTVRCALSGGSNVTLSGSTNRLELQAEGGSKANFVSFPAKEADVRLGGGSEATVAVEGKLDVSANGGATLYYTGKPTLGRVSVDGGGALKPR